MGKGTWERSEDGKSWIRIPDGRTGPALDGEGAITVEMFGESESPPPEPAPGPSYSHHTFVYETVESMASLRVAIEGKDGASMSIDPKAPAADPKEPTVADRLRNCVAEMKSCASERAENPERRPTMHR